MKKLLILAYDFPPYISVGGLRPYNWYKYLKEYGVEPIVITRQFDSQYGDERDYIAPSKSKTTVIKETEHGTILRSPYFPNRANKLLLKYGNTKYSWLRRLISAYYEIIQFLWVLGPKKQIYYTADSYLKHNKVDAIIATGDPFVLFFYAKKLSEKHNIPWIADYRDPWSQNKGRHYNRLFTYWNRSMEFRVLKSVSAVTTVSTFFQKKIEVLLPPVPFHILPNGYNPEVIDELTNGKQGSEELKIAFVGTIYNWHPWKSVLKVFSLWKQQNQGARMEIHFYGINISEELKLYIETTVPELSKYVVIHPKIPNEELLPKLAESNIMLLFNYYSYIGTKIYDYVGIRRKIVLCYENDKEAVELKEKHYNIEEIEGVSNRLQAELIEKTNSGIVVRDKGHLFEVFTELWTEFQQTGEIACESAGVENYSRKIQVKKLADIVAELT